MTFGCFAFSFYLNALLGQATGTTSCEKSFSVLYSPEPFVVLFCESVAAFIPGSYRTGSSMLLKM